MIRYDDNIYIAGLQSLYNVGFHICKAFYRGLISTCGVNKNVENLKSIHIFRTDKRATSESAKDEN